MSGVYAEQRPGERAVLVVHVVVHRHASPPVVDLARTARSIERDEVGGRRDAPGTSARCACRPAVRRRSRAPVGDDREVAPGTVAMQLPRSPCRWDSRRWGTRRCCPSVLALAPQLLRPVRPALGLDEREAAAVRDAAVVVDGEAVVSPKRERRAGGAPPACRLRGRCGAVAPRASVTCRHRSIRAAASSTTESSPARRATSEVVAPARERRGVPVEVPQLDALVHEIVVVGARVAVARHPALRDLRVQRCGREVRRGQSRVYGAWSHGVGRSAKVEREWNLCRCAASRNRAHPVRVNPA